MVMKVALHLPDAFIWEAYCDVCEPLFVVLYFLYHSFPFCISKLAASTGTWQKDIKCIFKWEHFANM